MKLEWRVRIARIKPLHQLGRVALYNSGWFFYRKIYRERNYAVYFRTIKGSKYGRRCFIIGNGPSLRSQDLDMLIGEDCFAANGIYHIFSATLWRPTYYLIMDRYFDAAPEEIREVECETAFFGDYYWRFNQVLRKDAVCLHQHIQFDWNHFKVSSDISKAVIISPTVSFTAMQIAAYLGYKEIYLLGFDHNYELEFDEKGKILRSSKNASHFFGDNQVFVANVIGMTKSYEAFLDYAKCNNITIKNATRGGKLEVFERVDFDELIKNDIEVKR